MRTVTIACAIAAFWPTAAVAQVHRLSVSALGGIDAGARGPIEWVAAYDWRDRPSSTLGGMERGGGTRTRLLFGRADR